MTIQEKAIEQLERISKNLASIGETVDYTDIAIQALEQARWIPIGEKLPNEYEYVFVSGDDIVKHAQFIDGRFDCDDIEKFMYATIDGKDVAGAETFKALAWMPVSLPEPYKEGAE